MAPGRPPSATSRATASVGVDNETVIMMAITALAVSAATIAVGTAVVSTALASRSWIPMPVHFEALVRLPFESWRPADAYPLERRDQIASPTLWWATAAALAAGVVALGAALARIVGRGGQGSGGWARRRDTRELRRAARDGGVVLGIHDRNRLAVESRHSLLVVGATQTHKTTGLAVPAILEADDKAIIAVSVKDDLVADTIGWRSRLAGQCWVFDPTNVLSSDPDADVSMLKRDVLRHARLRPRIVRASWSPLSNATTWQGALTTAFDLTRAGASADGGADGDNKFFYESAETMLACYLYAAANSSGSMRTVLRWIAQHVHEHVEQILEQLPSIEALEFFQGIFNLRLNLGGA